MRFPLKVVLTLISLNLSVVFSGILPKSTAPILDIPDGFLFGAGTSAYQIEGAARSHGRAESSIELILTQALPGQNSTASSGEIASDSYHRYKEDVQVLKYVGLNFYRFSMSWARLLPTGYANRVNQEGVDYYHALLDELEKAGVEPMVQLHHFDHPAILDKYGGWQNETMIELFRDYARFVFQEYGHRVKYFLTFNEPNILCNLLESGVMNHGEEIKSTFPRTYICSHNMLKAHAEAYHLYHDEFDLDKTGKISLNLLCNHFFAENGEDQELEDIAFAFGCGWFADPIYSKTGDYSYILKQRVEETNSLRGLGHLKLPTFSEAWIRKIRGSADFFGLSQYSTRPVEEIPADDIKGSINFQIPPEARLSVKASIKWLTNDSFVVPTGMRTVLNKVKNRYNNPDVHILENGHFTSGSLDDTDRMKYIYANVKEILDAMKYDQCNLKSYFYWSLIDTFEFWDGYRKRYGLAHIDFNSPNRTRTMRKSATWLKSVILKRKLYIEE